MGPREACGLRDVQATPGRWRPEATNLYARELGLCPSMAIKLPGLCQAEETCGGESVCRISL